MTRGRPTPISLDEFLTNQLRRESYLSRDLDDPKDRLDIARMLANALRESWSSII